MSLRIILTTGGTGGHIFPALAVAEALRKKRPDVELLFIGGLYGPEKDLVEKAGIPFIGLPVRGFIGRGFKAMTAMTAMIAGTVRALRAVREFRPHAVMGFGGYAAFAAVFAAWLLRRPCALHEQNAVPGAANRLLGRLVRRICLSWPQPSDHASFPPGAASSPATPYDPISQHSAAGKKCTGTRRAFSSWGALWEHVPSTNS